MALDTGQLILESGSAGFSCQACNVCQNGSISAQAHPIFKDEASLAHSQLSPNLAVGFCEAVFRIIWILRVPS